LTETRLHRFLSRFADIRPEEARVSLLLFLYFFLITFPAYIIKPVKETLLQASFDPRWYPLASLLTAVLIGFVVSLNAKLLGRLPRRLYVTSTLVFFIVSLILFRLLLTFEWRGLRLIYWFWSDVFIATSVTQFWIAVNDMYHPHQAKRLVGFFVSGGLLGGIGGALLALILPKLIHTENLLLVCPGLLVATLAVVNLLYREHPAERDGLPHSREGGRSRIGYLESFRAVRGSRYLVLLACCLASATIVSGVIQQQFLTITRAVFPDKDARTSFNGAFLVGLLVFSYLLNLLITGRILKKSGIRTALLIAPVFLLLGSAAVFIVPATFMLGWAVAVKGADKSFENTFSQSVRELLYIPVPAELKYKAKAFIDMFVNKFANGLGALLILFLLNVLRADYRQLSLLAVSFALIWILLIRLIFGEYVNAVKNGLKRKWQDGDKVIDENVDLDMTRLIFDTIQSREKSSVLYAMNLFDLIRKEKLSPELKQIITCKEDEIRAKSLGCLLDVGGETYFPEMADALAEEDFKTEIEEIMSLDSYKKVMEAHLAKTVVDRSKESEVDRMEAAKVIGLMEPTPSVVHNLRRLLEDKSPEVLTYALESAGRLKRKEFVPLVIQHLANPQTQKLAGDTLVAYGTKVIGALKEALLKSGEKAELRRAVPEVLARIGTQKAADFLAAGLARQDELVGDEIIGALYKLKSREPGIHIKEDKIFEAAFTEIHKGYKIVLGQTVPRPGEESADRAGRIDNLLVLRVQRIFELLTLVYPSEDIIKAYQNLCVGTKKAIDYSLELLDNVLDKDLKTFLLPLLEDLPADERMRRCRRHLKGLERMLP